MKRKTCTLYLSCEEYGVILDAHANAVRVRMKGGIL